MPATSRAPTCCQFRQREAFLSPLWRIVSDHLDSFLRHYEERHESTHGHLAPYVEKVLNQFLLCGDPNQGLTLFTCKKCNISLAVPFSCKKRICPSCMSRRAEDLSEGLGEALPRVPYRHVVVTLPRLIGPPAQNSRSAGPDETSHPARRRGSLALSRAAGPTRFLAACPSRLCCRLALEDKIVQRATVDVLNAIFEQDFAGFSYGFRPGRNQHKALKALGDGFIYKVSFVLDADIRGFFDTINHEWLIRFVEHRIGDQRVVRLVRKWLAVGVLEDGKRLPSAVGTPQGGSISPLLANIYLHYSLDLWVQWWRKQPGRGKVAFVRYADDFVVGFQLKGEADEFLRQLKERLAKFQLDLHPEKTRLIEFGPFAAMTRQKRGQGKPETFNFLGFTHICGKTQKGKFTIWRQTERKRMTAKLKALRLELRRRMHQKIPQVGKWLEAVLRGHYQYYGVSYNFRAIQNFRYQLSLAWFKTLRRRSQRHRTNWERMRRLIHKWLPAPRIVHSIFPGNQTAYPR